MSAVLRGHWDYALPVPSWLRQTPSWRPVPVGRFTVDDLSDTGCKVQQRLNQRLASNTAKRVGDCVSGSMSLVSRPHGLVVQLADVKPEHVKDVEG